MQKEFIDKRIEIFADSLYNALPAKIIAYDPNEQTVSVQPAMYEHYPDGASKTFAKLDNVPVIFPSSGGGSITFPVKKGDNCLLVFCARDFDNFWIDGNFPSRSTTARKLEYNDCVVLLGFKTLDESLKAHSDNVEIRYTQNGSDVCKVSLQPNGTITLENKDNTKVSVLPNGKVRIENSQEELISLLSDLIQTLADTTVTTIYGASPLNSKAQLTQLKAKLDTLKD